MLDIFIDGKSCTKCRVWKPVDGFSRHPTGRLGRDTQCKKCVAERQNQRNALPEVKARRAAYDKIQKSNPDVVARNKGLRKAPKRREKIRAWRRNKLRTDPRHAAIERARGMIHRTLASVGLNKSLPTFELLGYGPEKLMARISCQFKTGMSWANHGHWHIDHRKPLTAFVAQGETRPHIINALCNLQPLWGSENMSKNNKWPYHAPANDNVIMSSRILA